MQFHELTDKQWEFISPHIPPKAHTGRPREDDRKTINGILYVLLSGGRWMDMLLRYGSHKTVWELHKKWSEKGVWKEITDSLVSHGYQTGLVDTDNLSVDISTVAAEKGRKRLAMTATRRQREASYMRLPNSNSETQVINSALKYSKTDGKPSSKYWVRFTRHL